MKGKKVLIISGIIDFQLSGNQTIKQTVKFFEKKYFVVMLSFIPRNYPNLDINFEQHLKNSKVYRLPKILNLLFYLAKLLKELKFFKRKKKNTIKFNILDPLKSYSWSDIYFGFKPKLLIALYNLYSLGYLILEFPRALFLSIKEKPEFIYGYEREGALLAALIGKLLKIPVIKRFQGTYLEIENNSIKDKILHTNLILAYKLFNNPIVMANDGTSGDKVLKALGLSEKKFLFIINGLVTDTLDKAKYVDLRGYFDLPQNAKIIIMVSKLKLWKRVDRGIWLLHRLIKKLKRQDFYLLIVGDGESKSYLEFLSKKLDINNFVKFLGAKPHSEVVNLIKSSDVFWSFYEYTNLGNPLLEAIYLRKPVFTLDYRGELNSILGKDYKGKVSLEDFYKLSDLTLEFFENPLFKEDIMHSINKARENLLTWEERIKIELEWIKQQLNTG